MGLDLHRRDLRLDPNFASSRRSLKVSIRSRPCASLGSRQSPCDVAVVTSVLPKLAEQAQIDWSQPLSAWPKDTMASFLLLAWGLISKAETVRDHGPGRILRKSKDWATRRAMISRMCRPL